MPSLATQSALVVALASAPAPAAETPAPGDCHRVEVGHFVLHSDPWINLHHFLFQWARNTPERPPGDRRRPVEVPEAKGLGDLPPADRDPWQRAVDHYRNHVVAADLLFGRDLVDLRGRLAAIACASSDPDAIEPGLRAVLVAAMEVYRRHWWPGHDAENRSWIQEQREGLTTHGPDLARRLAAAYGGEWPAEPVRVDVTVYTNWAGAYTTNEPDHVTVSGRDYPGLLGLELLFHEVSHATFFEQRLLGHLAAAFRRQEVEQPRGLGHVVQFVTPAEILRSLLSEAEAEGVTFVADEMAERRRLRDTYRLVRRHWHAACTLVRRDARRGPRNTRRDP